MNHKINQPAFACQGLYDLRDEERSLMEELEKDMAENNALMASLKPRLAEQASLEEELEALRKERWQFEKVEELEVMRSPRSNFEFILRSTKLGDEAEHSR